MNGRSDDVASCAADYVVVAAGLTGAVIARMLFDAGRSVVVLERRAHRAALNLLADASDALPA